MNNKAKIIGVLIGIVIFTYALIMLFIVARGLVTQLCGFLNLLIEDALFMWLQQVFPLEWYVYVGSWSMSLLYVLSALRCINASRKRYEGHYIIITGMIGMIGYAISIITWFIYNASFHFILLHLLLHLIIFMTGLLLKFASKIQLNYEPLIVFIKQNHCIR